MNPIEALQSQLQRAYPNVEMSMSPPLRSDGIWQLQLVMPKPDCRRMYVDWQEDRFDLDPAPDPADYSHARLPGFPMSLVAVMAAVRGAIEN